MKTRPGSMDEYIVREMEGDPYRIRGIVHDDAVVVDAGANIGAFATYVLSVAPRARIICVEPHPGNAELCRENLSAAPRVSVVHAALMSREGEVVLHDFGDADSACHTVLDGALKEVTSVAVPATTLGSLMATYHLETIDLLKLDVQGAEFDIVDGCPADILRKISYIAMELHPCIRGNSGMIGRTPDSERKVRRLERKLSKTHVLVHGYPSSEWLTTLQWKNRLCATGSEKVRSSLKRGCRFAWHRLHVRRVIPQSVAARVRQSL